MTLIGFSVSDVLLLFTNRLIQNLHYCLMNRLLLVITLTCLCASGLFAQGSKGRMGSSTTQQTSLAPNNGTPSKSAKTTSVASAQGNDRNMQAPVSQNRTTTPVTTYGNANTKRSAQERSARPSDIKVNRPATYAPPTTTSLARRPCGGALGTT